MFNLLRMIGNAGSSFYHHENNTYRQVCIDLEAKRIRDCVPGVRLPSLVKNGLVKLATEG